MSELRLKAVLRDISATLEAVVDRINQANDLEEPMSEKLEESLDAIVAAAHFLKRFR